MQITLGNYTVELSEHVTYNVYLQEMDADELMEVDFGHINHWLHQKQVISDLTLFATVSIMKHPTVLRDKLKNTEDSQYWGKTDLEIQKLLKRESHSKKTDMSTARKLASPHDLDPQPLANKKWRMKKKLQELGYNKLALDEMINKAEAASGPGFFSMGIPWMIEQIDSMQDI